MMTPQEINDALIRLDQLTSARRTLMHSVPNLLSLEQGQYLIGCIKSEAKPLLTRLKENADYIINKVVEDRAALVGEENALEGSEKP